jgi:hypothetical protein
MNETYTQEDSVPLADICERYFGLSELVAKRKAAKGELPVKAFRLSGTRRGPLFVLKADLDALAKNRGQLDLPLE